MHKLIKHKYFYRFVFVLMFCAPILAYEAVKASDANTAAKSDTALSKLEDRFFEHQYSYDTDVDRLNRLEEFIYGAAQSGSVNQRIKHILATIPADEDDQAAGNAPSTQTKNQSVASSTQNTAQTQTQKSIGASNNQVTLSQRPARSATKSTFDYGSYPRVANLEQELLGRTYQDESLQDRLARLETKAYGAPSSSTDLCQRVDLLDDYAQRHDLYGDHKSVYNPPAALTFAPTTPVSPGTRDSAESLPDASTASAQQEYTSSNGTFVDSAEERVSMMEAQLFKHTYPDKPIDQRLKKLEKKILPTENISTLTPAQQTVKLWDTLHPNEKNQVAALAANANQTPAAADDTAGNTQPTNTKHSSWLHKLANAAGTSSYGGLSGPGSSTPTTYGTNIPFYGSGMPGYGNGRFIGVSAGPGAGPGGLPLGFW